MKIIGTVFPYPTPVLQLPTATSVNVVTTNMVGEIVQLDGMSEFLLHLLQEFKQHIFPKRVKHNHNGIFIKVKVKDISLNNMDIGICLRPLLAHRNDITPQLHSGKFALIANVREVSKDASLATTNVKDRIFFREV